MRRRAREQGGTMKMREPQRTIARVLICMNEGEPTAALDYVSRSKKNKCWESATKGQLEAELRDWWRATDVDKRQAYLVLDESNRKMHRAILQARRFAVDGTLEAWVDTQNVQKGINPAPGVVMEQAVALKRRLGVEAPVGRQSSRRWLQRWRRRRGIHLRRENVRERLSADEMRRKATHRAARKLSTGWSGFLLGGVRAPKNGDHFLGTKSSPPLFVVIKIAPRKWPPFFAGPRRQSGTQELLSVFSGRRFVEVEQLPAALRPA